MEEIEAFVLLRLQQTGREAEQQIKNVKRQFYLAFDATAPQEIEFFRQLDSYLRSMDKTIEQFCEAVDTYCRWELQVQRARKPQARARQLCRVSVQESIAEMGARVLR